MTQQSFNLGNYYIRAGNTVIKTVPIDYTPAGDDTNSEAVLIYGNSIPTNATVLEKIVINSILNENMPWVIIHTSGHFLTSFSKYNVPQAIYLPAQMSLDGFETFPYTTSVRYLNEKISNKLFQWKDSPLMIDTYNLIWDQVVRSNQNYPTYKQLIAAFEAETQSTIDKGKVKTVKQILNSLTTNKALIAKGKRSRFVTDFITAIREKKGMIFHIYIPDLYPNYKTLVSCIINEVKTALREAKFHRCLTKTGIVIDGLDNHTVNEPLIFPEIHDLFFSWGRTLKVTRIGINNSDAIPEHELLRDGLDNRSQSGPYQMLLHSNPDGTVDFLNRLQMGDVLESEIDGNAKPIAFYQEKIEIF